LILLSFSSSSYESELIKSIMPKNCPIILILYIL